MNEGEKEKDLRAAVEAMIGERKGKKSAAAIFGPEPEVHPEALLLLLGPRRPGENADCNSCGLKTAIERKDEEEDVSEGSFEALVQPESVIESVSLPSLPANDSFCDALEKPSGRQDQSKKVVVVETPFQPLSEPEPRPEHVVENSQCGVGTSAENICLAAEEEPPPPRLQPWPAPDTEPEPDFEPPSHIDDNSSSIWHTLSTWWKKDKRKKHTINWADIEIDACPPPDFVEEPWQLSSPDFIEEPRLASPPEHHEPELEAPPSSINDYSSSGWSTLLTWWRKEKREKRTLTWADIDACPPPGYTEESGMTWTPQHESELPTTERSRVLSNFKPVVVDLAETVDDVLGEQKRPPSPPDFQPLGDDGDTDMLQASQPTRSTRH